MIPSWNLQSQYGLHRTRTFKQIFEDKDAFRTDYTNISLGGFTKDETLNNLYALLYARRGNDAIYFTDEEQFKYALFSIVFQYGPEYETKLEIQRKIRNLSEQELEKGTTSIYNNAQNPSTIPMTQEFEQLKKIDSQSASGIKRSKMDYLHSQAQVLDSAFIETFMKRFDRLFNPFPAEFPLIYDIEGEEDDDE